MIETGDPQGADRGAQETPLQVEVGRAMRIAKEAQTLHDRVGTLVDRTIGQEPTAPALVDKALSVDSVGGKVGEIQQAQTDTLGTQRSIAELLTRLEQNL